MKNLLPGRSMFAFCGEKKATATWAFKYDFWFCESASIHLKWMKGMRDFDTAKRQLRERGFKWEWITPNVGSCVKPPFTA